MREGITNTRYPGQLILLILILPRSYNNSLNGGSCLGGGGGGGGEITNLTTILSLISKFTDGLIIIKCIFWFGCFQIAKQKALQDQEWKTPEKNAERLSSLCLHSFIIYPEIWCTSFSHPSVNYLFINILLLNFVEISIVSCIDCGAIRQSM